MHIVLLVQAAALVNIVEVAGPVESVLPLHLKKSQFQLLSLLHPPSLPKIPNVKQLLRKGLDVAALLLVMAIVGSMVNHKTDPLSIK